MKTLLFVLLTAFTSLNVSANDRLPRILSADIYSMKLDPSAFGEETFDSGRILINSSDRSASLVLNPTFYCPPPRACAAVMPEAVRIALPIVSRKTGQCGEIVTVARRDLRPADGVLQTLTIVDHSRDVCEYRLEATVIATYHTTSLRGAKTHSKFLAREFEVIRPQYSR